MDSIEFLKEEATAADGDDVPETARQLRKVAAELGTLRDAASSWQQCHAERLARAASILDERDRQDSKWGPQDHTLPEWVTILMEEVGELAAAVLCHKFGNDDHPELDWRKEAIQVAAVALSMCEQYKEPKEASG